MSFRRESSRHQAWRKWVDEHRAELLGAGIPDWILTDELSWFRFLEEGCDLASGWSPRMLDVHKARNLHAFIQEEYGDEQYRGMLHDIEVYLSETSIK